MKGIREEYRSAKQALASRQSEENYKELISECYEVLVYHRELCRENEFAGTLQLYEDTALSFWRQYKTAESLCHLVHFYGDWQILDYFNWLPDRKHHLLKGLGYVREYHRMEDADYSAALFVRHYLSLCETCRSGEQEEQLSYARAANRCPKVICQDIRYLRMA